MYQSNLHIKLAFLIGLMVTTPAVSQNYENIYFVALEPPFYGRFTPPTSSENGEIKNFKVCETKPLRPERHIYVDPNDAINSYVNDCPFLKTRFAQKQFQPIQLSATEYAKMLGNNNSGGGAIWSYMLENQEILEDKPKNNGFVTDLVFSLEGQLLGYFAYNLKDEKVYAVPKDNLTAWYDGKTVAYAPRTFSFEDYQSADSVENLLEAAKSGKAFGNYEFFNIVGKSTLGDINLSVDQYTVDVYSSEGEGQFQHPQK